MRAEGRPSGVAVASATASGSKAPALAAASNQRRKTTSGSGSRSFSPSGRSRGSVTGGSLADDESAAAAGLGHRHQDLPADGALARAARHLAECIAAGVEVDQDPVGVADGGGL